MYRTSDTSSTAGARQPSSRFRPWTCRLRIGSYGCPSYPRERLVGGQAPLRRRREAPQEPSCVVIGRPIYQGGRRIEHLWRRPGPRGSYGCPCRLISDVAPVQPGAPPARPSGFPAFEGSSDVRYVGLRGRTEPPLVGRSSWSYRCPSIGRRSARLAAHREAEAHRGTSALYRNRTSDREGASAHALAIQSTETSPEVLRMPEASLRTGHGRADAVANGVGPRGSRYIGRPIFSGRARWQARSAGSCPRPARSGLINARSVEPSLGVPRPLGVKARRTGEPLQHPASPSSEAL